MRKHINHRWKRVWAGLLVSVMLAGCFWGIHKAEVRAEGTGGDGPIVFSKEAKDGVLTNGASSFTVNDLATGNNVTVVGVGTDNVQDRPNGTCTFTDVTVPSEGLYWLDIYYCADNGDRYFDMYVNGEYKKVQCPASGPWYTVGKYRVSVALLAGANELSFSCANWYAPNLQKIEVVAQNEGTEQTVSLQRIVLEAETADVSGGATIDLNEEYCSGSGKVGYIGGDQDGTVSFDVTVDQGGEYGLVISYCTADPRAFEVEVGGETEFITFSSSGDWNRPNDYVMAVNLQAGHNEIKVHNSAGYAPNLDKIEVFPAQVISMGGPQLIYDMENGVYSITQHGKTVIEDAFAKVLMDGEEYTSGDYTERTATKEQISDAFGNGFKLTVVNTADDLALMKQEFCIYENKDYLLTTVTMDAGEGSVATNWISPVTTNRKGSVENNIGGSNYAIRVPYDNDSWITYDLQTINGSGESYEVTAIFDKNDATGLVLGSVTHDTWKTGISYT
ncbi:MAG: hypothetical protein J6033_01225, partial [Lachnospiraceae bacterium]|nr:hypothetical protein [Lachnospiraceae bacterium]